MKDLFIPSELASIADQKQFNEPCLAFYDENKEINYFHSNNPLRNSEMLKGCTAPLYQQIIDWFREDHKIELSIYHEVGVGWWMSVNSIDNGGPLVPTNEYNDYYEALNKAIEEAFKLI